MMDKVDVNGPNTSPVWKFLKEQSGKADDVTWNFAAKFIVDKDGNVVVGRRVARASTAQHTHVMEECH